MEREKMAEKCSLLNKNGLKQPKLEAFEVDCCIAGGGPAGMMLGLLFAKAGIQTIVLEKWPDFFRDFRGDTIHPSTMQVLNELNLLEEFLKLPINKTYQLKARIGFQQVTIADFSHLKVLCPFIAFIPQWDFLNFIAKEAQRYPNFQLLMETEATNLIKENKKIVGLKAKQKNTSLNIFADLVIGADGRHSIIQEKSGLTKKCLSAPMDVLWFRLSRKKTDPKQSLGNIDLGKMMVMINRDQYWQCGLIIKKGTFKEIQQSGLLSFQQSLVELVPFIAGQVSEIKNWDQVKLLEVTVDRLEKWYQEGLLCIGDCAHAMSPIGGVGINLAIQDAVATANLLIPKLLKKSLSEKDLLAVQKRRSFPTQFIQYLQTVIQNKVIKHVLGNKTHPKVPFLLKFIQWFPYFQRLPAYLIGVGPRPETILNKQDLGL